MHRSIDSLQDKGRTAMKPVTPAAFGEIMNEGQAAKFFGMGRRKFAYVRKEQWFIECCAAREAGPRSLRFLRSELLAAMANAPRRVVLAEPAQLAASRAERLAP